MSRLASSSSTSTSASTSASPLPSRSGTPSSSLLGVGGGVGGGWDAQRRSTRTLESQLDARLTRYATLASKIASEDGAGAGAGERGRDSFVLDMDGGGGGGGGGSGDGSGKGRAGGEEEHVVLERDIEALLGKLQSAVSSLSSVLEDPDLPPSTVQLHAVQRHREVLMDFERDFRRSKSNVRHAIDRRDLVGRVRGDISAYKAAAGGHSSDAEALLAERGRLDNSHAMIDGTLEQAYATLTDFQAQRQVLAGVANRMSSTAARVPAINGIMTMIGRRRRRDSVIMGCLIGCGTVLLLMYITRGV